MVTPVKRIDLTPTPRGYATSLAAIIRGGTYQDKQWVLREMIRACKAVLPEPKKVSGPGYVTVAPTPEGYARIFYRLIEQGDAKGRAYAISEMTRIFEAAFKKKNPKAPQQSYPPKHGQVSDEAFMLKDLITETDNARLRRVLGTEKVGLVLRDICLRRGLQNNLIVHSALIELTPWKLPGKTAYGTTNPRRGRRRV